MNVEYIGKTKRICTHTQEQHTNYIYVIVLAQETV